MCPQGKAQSLPLGLDLQLTQGFRSTSLGQRPFCSPTTRDWAPKTRNRTHTTPRPEARATLYLPPPAPAWPLRKGEQSPEVPGQGPTTHRDSTGWQAAPTCQRRQQEAQRQPGQQAGWHLPQGDRARRPTCSQGSPDQGETTCAPGPRPHPAPTPPRRRPRNPASPTPPHPTLPPPPGPCCPCLPSTTPAPVSPTTTPDPRLPPPLGGHLPWKTAPVKRQVLSVLKAAALSSCQQRPRPSGAKPRLQAVAYLSELLRDGPGVCPPGSYLAAALARPCSLRGAHRRRLRLLFIKGGDERHLREPSNYSIPAQRTEGSCVPGRLPGVRPLLGV